MIKERVIGFDIVSGYRCNALEGKVGGRIKGGEVKEAKGKEKGENLGKGEEWEGKVRSMIKQR